MEKIAVSACLLGVNCKYNGSNNLNLHVLEAIKGKEVILICPEVMGGLSTPRIPNEIQADGRVLNLHHEDMTSYFNSGKMKTLNKLLDNQCKQVILKDGSPSCGYQTIYDGNFTNTKIKGLGVTTKLLKKHHIQILEIK
jgi:uncharacterized protein YbbK (DUF523 family)